jgi:hypothetical protein
MFAPKVAKPQTKAAASSTNKLAPHRSTLAVRPPGNGTVEQARFLQSTIGNQATLRLLVQPSFSLTKGEVDRHHEQEGTPAKMVARGATPGVSWDFSKIPIFSPDRHQAGSPLTAQSLPGILQPRLLIGEVNDPLEHEAERVAGQVMRMPAAWPSLSSAPTQLTRKCAACEEQEKLQKKETGPQTVAGEAPASVHQTLRSPGQPLDMESRAYFEPRFGRNLSQVRIHADARAAESAHSVHARAYAVGNHVVFGRNQYAPDTADGRHLLAHELTHTLQQQGGVPSLQRAPPNRRRPRALIWKRV